MEKVKSFFKDINFNSDIIACVGDNSGINLNQRDCMISSGYMEAAEVLLKFARDNCKEDELIYPFAFNCRQAIELSLKQCIYLYGIINTYRNKKYHELELSENEKNLKSHDLSLLSNYIIRNSKFIDCRIKEFIENNNFDAYISEFYFDKEGDTFRYTFNVHRTKINIENSSHISMTVMYENCKKGYDIINQLYDMLVFLIREDSLNTHTNLLNREQILEIAKQLPPYSTWNKENDSFINVKLKYKLSSNEFNRVCNIIKKHRKFCTYIGLENKFGDITIENFQLLKEIISLKERNIKNKGPINKLISIEEIKKKQEIYVKLYDYANKIDLITIKLLLTYYEIGKYNLYPELLERTFENNSKNISLDFDYLLGKINFQFLNFLKKGLLICGQITILKRVESVFDI